MKVHAFILNIIAIGVCFADCEFMVTNNSKEAINIEAGYFNKDKTNFTVQPAMSGSAVIKNDLNCNAVTKSGLGITYINLSGGRSRGGWVYDPMANMIRANGEAYVSATGRIGISPKGIKLFLLNTYRPDANLFVVQIKNADRNISRQFGSMD